MATFTLYNTNGEQVGTIEQPLLFTTPVDQKLIHRYLTWVRTMMRSTIAHTKTRGEVRGGGRKPWKQKGTGRARIGSTRAPHWRKGGIVFGPLSTQNWATRMPRSERRKALFSALAAKALNNQVIILDEWTMETPKTREALAVLNTLPQVPGSKVLHLHEQPNSVLSTATRNLPLVSNKTVVAMSIVDILNNDILVLTKATLESLEQHFTPSV